MSGPSFTPGPWVIGEHNYGLGQRIAATIGGVTFTICNAETPLQGGPRHDMREANCKLIAAAPDMFDALKLAAEELATIAVTIGEDGWSAVSIERHDSICAVGDKIAAILAKARGEAQ